MPRLLSVATVDMATAILSWVSPGKNLTIHPLTQSPQAHVLLGRLSPTALTNSGH